MYTDLDAVNHLLSQVGAAPVTTLTPATPTVASALLRIEEAVRWVLKKGWWFNKYRIEAIPDGDGEITVQSTVIKAVAFHEFVIVKDDKLYAPRRNSFVFDMAFEVTITEIFPFEELPQAQDMMERNLAAGKLVVRVQIFFTTERTDSHKGFFTTDFSDYTDIMEKGLAYLRGPFFMMSGSNVLRLN